MSTFGLIAVLALVLLVVIVIGNTARIVPQQSGHVVERLGRYARTPQAGFHILIPFLERVWPTGTR